MKKLTLISFGLVLTVCARAQSQGTGIGTISPDASSQLDVTSTTKGFLPPRMDSTQRNAISNPAAGLVIFNTSTKQLEVNTGSAASPVWSSTKAGTTASTTLTSATSPAGTSVGQMMYNTGSTQPTGLIYWDGTQWKSVASSGGNTTNNYTVVNNKTVTNNDSVINNNPVINNDTSINNGPVYNTNTVTNGGSVTNNGAVTNNSTSTFNGAATFNKKAVFNDTAVFSGGMKVSNLPQGQYTDSVLVFEPTTKVMRRISVAGATAATQPWYKAGTTTAATANTDSVYISGKVGIGTATPNSLLHVSALGPNAMAIERTNAAGYPTRLSVYKNEGAVQGTPAAVSNGSAIGSIDFYAHNGTAYPAIGQANASITSYATEPQTPTSGGAALTFKTIANGTTAPMEAMRINHDGHVSIGTTNNWGVLNIVDSANSASTTYRTLLAFGASNGGVGTLYRRNNGTTEYVGMESFNAAGTVKTPIVFNEYGGNVGIGTSNPAGKLHVSGDGSAAWSSSQVFMTNTQTGGHSWALGPRALGTTGDFSVSDETDGVIRMAIQGGTGNVGIGTVTPMAPLHVLSTTGVNGIAIERIAPATSSARLALYKNNSGAAVTAGSSIGSVEFYAHNGTAYPVTGQPNAAISSVATENQSTTAGGAALVFRTLPNGTTAPIQEQMRIDQNGYVGIGTATPASKLHISGDGTSGSTWNAASVFFTNTATGGHTWAAGARGSGTGTAGDFAISDETNQVIRMVIQGGTGYVGVGTTTPKAPVHIVATNSASFSTGAISYFNSGIASVATATSTGPRTDASLIADGSIWTKGSIVSAASITYSDRRIKNIIGQSDAHKDLELLNKFRITDYRMKDAVKFGNQQYKKVIAQEVEEVYPQAVTTQTGFVPNIYQPADKVENLGNNTYRVSFKNKVEYNKNVTGDLKLYDEKQEITARVVSRDNNTIVFTTTDMINGNKLFLYGEEVTDFKAVDYEALSTLNISATQELYREIQELKKKNAELTASIEDTKKLEGAYAQLAAQVREMQQAMGIPVASGSAAVSKK